jgi:hypothetical protein
VNSIIHSHDTLLQSIERFDRRNLTGDEFLA